MARRDELSKLSRRFSDPKVGGDFLKLVRQIQKDEKKSLDKALAEASRRFRTELQIK